MDLTDEQKYAFKLLNQNKNIFITSKGAGCGKTHLLNSIVSKYKNTKNIAVTASTGIAAVLINGMTIHSWAGVGLCNKPIHTLYTNIKSKKNIHKRWMDVNMIIIDEVSLLSASFLDTLEELARMIRGNEEPFGGIQIALCGDWLQLPTIDSDKYAFEARCWDTCIDDTVYLTQIQRQSDKLFQDILNEIRVGRITKKVKEVLRSRLNVTLDNRHGITPTKLYALNSNVDKINNRHLSDLMKEKNRDKRHYKIKWVSNKISSKKIEDYFTVKTPVVNIHDERKITDEQITEYIKMCNAVEILDLCVDAQVILLVNLDQTQHLINGSRGVVTGFNDNGLPIVKFLNGITEVIGYKTWEIEIDGRVQGYFEQIPLKLGYATSIHKSQGSTLDYVELDLKNIFELSQAYVGLSRVTSLEGLSITGLDLHKFKVSIKALDFYKKLDSTK